MNNLLVHRSHPRPLKGLTTISPAIIDDKEQTPMCGPWRWRIPKLRIAPAFCSLYFRLRGRTPVTLLKPSDNDSDVSNGQRSPTRGSNKVEPLTPIVFSTSSSSCLQASIINQCPRTPVPSSSSMSVIRDISTPSRFSLPGAVGESEATVQSDTIQSVSAYNSQTSDSDKSCILGKAEAKTVFFHRPKYTCQSSSDHLIYQKVGESVDIDESGHAASEAILDDHDLAKGSTEDMDSLINNSDIKAIHGKSTDTSPEKEVQHTADILVITHSSSSSPSHASSDTDSDVDISDDYKQSCSTDEIPEPRPSSRMGRECWGEQKPYSAEEFEVMSSSVDFRKPEDTDQAEFHWARSEETTVMTVENDSELEEELDYYENNDEEGDDYLDMDKILRKCPPTEVLQNLRDMVQLSKNTTNQLEKALRQAARISCGPFPRLTGSGLTKTEVIDLKCAKLVGETEDFLGDMNKNFLTFYTVLEQMDKVSAQQDSFVSSILVKRGPRDWRTGHAAIMRKMDKLWSTDYPKVITRKLKGSIQETIYEVDGE